MPVNYTSMLQSDTPYISANMKILGSMLRRLPKGLFALNVYNTFEFF